MYSIFKSVCHQIREDSYEIRKMNPKNLEMFIRLY